MTGQKGVISGIDPSIESMNFTGIGTVSKFPIGGTQ